MVLKNAPVWMGTASGTLLSSLGLIRTEDIFKTVLLASIGAIVSFVISCFLNLIIKMKNHKFKKHKKNK